MSVHWNLYKTIDLPNQDATVYKVQYAPEGDLLAAATSDGHVHLYSTETNKLLSSLQVSYGEESAVLSIDFKPLKASGMFQTTKNVQQRVLMVAHGFKGIITFWDILQSKQLRAIQEKGNEVHTVSYRKDGKLFATAGKDRSVRVYDSKSYELKMTLNSSSVNFDSVGHINRVFCVKFHPIDTNILLSAGWDANVQIWSLRDKGAIRSLHGAYICGDSLDVDPVKGDAIVTGSWRPEDQIQYWNFKTGKLLKTLPFDDEEKGDGKPKLNVYCTRFNPEADTVACGGSGSKGIKILDRYSGKILGSMLGLKKGIYTAEFSPIDSVLACAGGDGKIYIFNKSFSLSSRAKTETQSDVI